MLKPILSRRQEEMVAEERRQLAALRSILERFGLADDDRAALDASLEQLDDLFLLVVLGEFNSGKSTFINALLGQQVLEEGVTPTTTRLQLLRHGEAISRGPGGPGLDLVTAPVDFLATLNIVDTPGTNAIYREHELLTREFVPRSDLVLFVTSADRPFTESERSFLADIRDWGKKVVLVVNKVDILETADEEERVRSFVAENARTLLGTQPEVFAVSARRALKGKLAGGAAEAGGDGGFARLEAFITATLDEEERVRLKLLNPLGVGLRLLERYRGEVAGRLDLIKEDVAAIEDVETQLGAYREDMGREFRYRLADVDNLLHEFQQRGMEFFDDTMRLARFMDLLNRSRIKADFERRVVSDMPERVEERVEAVIDWMVSRDLEQWQAVMEHVERRRAAHAERIVGRVGGGFELDRRRLLETVRRASRQAVESYDEEKEAARLADGVQAAVASTALVEVGAVGLGTVVTLLATSTMADVTGLVAAGTLAVLGLFVIPARRREAKRELKAKIADMRQRLMGALTEHFDREVRESEGRIRNAIAPYTRFIRTEHDTLTGIGSELAEHRDRLDALKERLG